MFPTDDLPDEPKKGAGPRGRVLLTCLALLAWGVCTSPVVGQEATAEAVSDRVLEGTILLPNGNEARISVREGSMVTVRDNATGETTGFAPRIRPDGGLDLLTLEIRENIPGSQTAHQVDDLSHLQFGQMERVAAGLSVSFDPKTYEDRFVNEAVALPVSDKIVAGSIVLPNGEIAKVSVQEGTMATVRDNGTGETFGFAPKLDRKGGVDLMTLRIEDQGPDGQRVEQVGDLASLGAGESASAVGSLSVTFNAPEAGASSKSARLGAEGDPAFEGGNCCVTCYGYTVCACTVSLSCGSCTGTCSGGGGSGGGAKNDH